MPSSSTLLLDLAGRAGISVVHRGHRIGGSHHVIADLHRRALDPAGPPLGDLARAHLVTQFIDIAGQPRAGLGDLGGSHRECSCSVLLFVAQHYT
ncbi:MAG: hypothetical protein M3Z00_10095 [Actinomycetota bacterium]|nr:hypothetical protein [Actinomycetota bacterium]